MARIFTGLFGGTQQTQAPATALRVTQSLQGVPIAILLGGQNRMAANITDYVGFVSYNIQAPGGGGGKGGIGGGGGGGAETVYFVTFNAAVGEGNGGIVLKGVYIGGTYYSLVFPDPSVLTVVAGGRVTTFNYEVFDGDYLQQPWGYFEVAYPTHALNNRGVAYFAAQDFPLGTSPSLPTLTFEGASVNNNTAMAGQPDGYVDVAYTDFLTNPNFGVGFPSARLGNLAQWRSYCLSLGMVVSPVIASSIQAASFCNDLTDATNSASCWQDGLLTVVPYGDTTVTAGQIETSTETYAVPASTNNAPQINVEFIATFVADGGVTYASGEPLGRVTVFNPGVSPNLGQYYELGGSYYFCTLDLGQEIFITYTYAQIASYVPNTQSLYDFTLDDFLPNQGSIGAGLSDANSPLIVVRKPRDQMLNTIKVEYLDRNNAYNPVDIEYKDEASIETWGRVRASEIKQFHFFCLAAAAQQSAVLQLARAQIARTFQWTCGRHFMLILELMGLCTVSDPAQGIIEQPVRIIEIQENADFSLTITAEEFMGTVSAPEYGIQPSTGMQINFNEDPGGINAPVIFEPTDQLNQTNALGGLQIWTAVSGVNETTWGGCNVWVSYDNLNYSLITQQFGPARMGVTTSLLPSVTPAVTGQTLDTSDILSVNLGESAGILASASNADAIALNTRSYVGGEIISYATATLIGANNYNLSYMVRGAYGSTIASHPIGTPFVRLDTAVAAETFDQTRIGATIYFKFQSFNIYGGGTVPLSSCAAYPYVITGSALASPLPAPANLRTAFDINTGFSFLDWDDITDFRQFKYEVRSGTAAASGFTLGQVAHPPFRVPGPGTYWVAAVSQPAPGLTVYSTWQDVVIAGAVITQNIIKTFDLKAANWPGAFTGGAGVDSGLNAIRSGGGNILVDTNVLTTPNVLTYGSSQSGVYYPGANAFIDIGYVANASVSIQYQPTGVPVGQNILTIGNILTTPDILGSASTQFINVYPQIMTATMADSDLYSFGDLYTGDDLYSAGDYNWTTWQRFSPGVYQARALIFSMVLETFDPNTIAYNLAFAITITIPGRPDTFALTTSTAGDITVNFAPGATQSVLTNNTTATSSAIIHVAAVPSWVVAGMYAFDATSPTSIVSGQTVLSTGVGTITLSANVDATVGNGDLVTFSNNPPAAFNAGPGAANLPSISWGITNAQAGDDLIVTALSLSSFSIKVLNGGSRVSRTVNLFAQGY